MDENPAGDLGTTRSTSNMRDMVETGKNPEHGQLLQLPIKVDATTNGHRRPSQATRIGSRTMEMMSLVHHGRKAISGAATVAPRNTEATAPISQASGPLVHGRTMTTKASGRRFWR